MVYIVVVRELEDPLWIRLEVLVGIRSCDWWTGKKGLGCSVKDVTGYVAEVSGGLGDRGALSVENISAQCQDCSIDCHNI